MPTQRNKMNSFSSNMSDNSENSDEKSTNGICRDFLRNVCKRGKRCKFHHPNVDEAKELGRQHEYTFCHDYQNSGCRRTNCKFIHCTREEEDYYKQTGQLPVRLQQAAALGIGVVPNDLPLLKGEVPICKDFLKGDCKRANRCKFRHLNPTQYDLEVTRGRDQPRGNNHVAPKLERPFESFNDDFERFDYEHTSAKRRRLDSDTFDTFDRYQLRNLDSLRNSIDYRLIEDENVMLRRKLEELKKQVSDLAATNEVLLEQNARYRVNKAANIVTSAPIVTVSQVIPSMAPIVARGAMHAHHIPQHSMSRLNTNTLRQAQATLTVNANSELIVSQQVLQPRLSADLQPRMAADLAQQHAANIAQQPPPATINVPVSMPMNPIVGDTALPPPPHPGSLASVSLAQPNLPQPHQSAVTPVSLPQTSLPTLVSGLNTPLISYPIMSHSITQLPNNSLG